MAGADVSVIIPTFNRGALLARALESISVQTVPPREVIVIDDGSTDSSEQVVRRCSVDACYFRQPRAGVSAARNAGIRRARGTWLAFLDSDDQWLERKLEIQMAALANEPSYKLCYTDEIWIRDGRRVNAGRRHRKVTGWMLRESLALCLISPSSVLVHRSVFDAVGRFDESLPACEDYDHWLRICSRWPVLLVNEPLITKYGGRADQL